MNDIIVTVRTFNAMEIDERMWFSSSVAKISKEKDRSKSSLGQDCISVGMIEQLIPHKSICMQKRMLQKSRVDTGRAYITFSHNFG